MIIDVEDEEGRERRVGRKVEMPFMTPKRLVSNIWVGLGARLVG